MLSQHLQATQAQTLEIMPGGTRMHGGTYGGQAVQAFLQVHNKTRSRQLINDFFVVHSSCKLSRGFTKGTCVSQASGEVGTCGIFGVTMKPSVNRLPLLLDAQRAAGGRIAAGRLGCA